jgi:LPS sulfotransferase NodH
MKNTIILFEGRTGSTHLATLLQQSPKISFLGEEPALLKPEGWNAQQDWICQLFDDPLNFNDPRIKASSQVIGFRIKLRDVVDLQQFKSLLEKYDVSIIYMRRLNLVKQAISSIRAIDLSKSKGYYNLDYHKHQEGLAAYPIPLKRFEQTLKWIEDVDLKLQEFIKTLNQPICEVSYEDLLSDRDAVLNQVIQFLDVPPFTPKEVIAKHTSDDLSQVISNFDALVSHYQGTAYAEMLMEGTSQKSLS